ncbi:GspE/PulE family protein [Idiomarina xiamenensis]|uniref:Bacterial type II secretion system protein E domain-containing protein n=1 Tax=Idiomarina xiamenensis 10-D-4 TaxID=740709 RepID=K2KBW0_9GAMM|nr:GspE/PulE family protein [Idiomarina xiamenensis]EKE85318.1 hypothetical protein A10D4_03200 [Idiomarina xiamenensis 10-D-4]
MEPLSLQLEHWRPAPGLTQPAVCLRLGYLLLGHLQQRPILAGIAMPDSAQRQQLQFQLQQTPLYLIANAQALNDRLNAYGGQHASQLDDAKAQLAHIAEHSQLRQASDIHIEPLSRGGRIRLRVHGLLQPLLNLSREQLTQLLGRIKVLAKLDVSEQRLPQDGRLTLSQPALGFRVSTLATVHGEKAVLRRLPEQRQLLPINQAIPEPTPRGYLLKAIAASQGLVLLTGPTGSGKTATLYSAIVACRQQHRNVCSIEDPVELVIDDINQSSVNRDLGLGFAELLKSLLRQDPDVIVLGEIRDTETANIALQAAESGHLVIATLHSPSATASLQRLQHLGQPTQRIEQLLSIICHQRLLRLLCPHCKQRANTSATQQHYQAVGCERCEQGYYRRQAVLGCWSPTGHLNYSLYASAKRLLDNGDTSLSEVRRVLGNIDDSQCHDTHRS